jgi:hypothetical protein
MVLPPFVAKEVVGGQMRSWLQGPMGACNLPIKRRRKKPVGAFWLLLQATNTELPFLILGTKEKYSPFLIFNHLYLHLAFIPIRKRNISPLLYLDDVRIDFQTCIM